MVEVRKARRLTRIAESHRDPMPQCGPYSIVKVIVDYCLGDLQYGKSDSPALAQHELARP